MNNFLLGYDFSDILFSTDVEFIWQLLKSSITTAISSFTPTFKHSKSNHPRWFTSDIRHQLNCIRTLKRRCRTTDSPALSLTVLQQWRLVYRKTFLLLNLILKPNWCMTFPTQSLREFSATSSLFLSNTLFHLLCL